MAQGHGEMNSTAKEVEAQKEMDITHSRVILELPSPRLIDAPLPTEVTGDSGRGVPGRAWCVEGVRLVLGTGEPRTSDEPVECHLSKALVSSQHRSVGDLVMTVIIHGDVYREVRTELPIRK